LAYIYQLSFASDKCAIEIMAVFNFISEIIT